jgi:hypothetical protein
MAQKNFKYCWHTQVRLIALNKLKFINFYDDMTHVLRSVNEEFLDIEGNLNNNMKEIRESICVLRPR